jgi:hypothetical protein
MKLARLLLLATAALPWAQGSVRAQAMESGNGRTSATPAKTPETGRTQSDEIVITAQRYGDAQVEAETEMGEEEISSYGADNIEELVKRLGPLGGAAEDEPVILINGQEVGFDRSVLGYPPEALNRIAILRPEAAARYGHQAGRRVVNLVLKKSFASRDGNASFEWATRGGQYGGTLAANQVAIAGPMRWNAQVRIALDSALRTSARNVPPRTGAVDLVGYVAGLNQGEIDPALSQAAGGVVTFAAIPASSLSRMPILDDFAATANRAHPGDPRDYETLRPSRRNLTLQLGATRPVGPFNASLSINASSNISSALRGLPMASITLPAGSPWSPFAGDVLLVRPLASDRPLRQETRSESLGIALTLSGRLGSWQTSFSGSYTRNWSLGSYDRGVDVTQAQELIDRGDSDFNPYAPWGQALLRTEYNRSRGENMSARFNVSRPVVTLPAGPLTVSISGSASRSRTDNRRSDNNGDLIATDIGRRGQLGGQISLAIPVSRRGGAEIGPLGDLALDLTAGRQAQTGSRAQQRFGAGFTWSPFPVLQLRGAFDRQDAVPTFDQLDAPLGEAVRRVYDFSRQETVEAVWITGGNPLLRGGSRQSLSLSALVRPLASEMLTLDFAYRERNSTGGVAPFPELTPVIEAAFPERITRDPTGRLVAVDARAINIARASQAELSTSIALRFPDPGAKPNGAARKMRDPLRFSLTLNHSVRLKSEFLTRPGVPVIDQLRDTGQPRHAVSLQAVVGNGAFGADANATWSSAASLRNRGLPGPQQEYRYRQPLQVRLGLFVDPGDVLAPGKRTGILKNMRISLDVDNLFDSYRRATLADGTVPPGYSRDEIDPLGRTVRLSVRKRF